MSSTAQQRQAQHSLGTSRARARHGTMPRHRPGKDLRRMDLHNNACGVPTATGTARRVPHSPAAPGKIEPSPPCLAPRRLHRGRSSQASSSITYADHGERRPIYNHRGTLQCAATCEYSCKFSWGRCQTCMRLWVN